MARKKGIGHEKECVRCRLTFYTHDYNRQLCDSCLKSLSGVEKNSATNHVIERKERVIFTNEQLGKQQFNQTLAGFEQYLLARRFLKSSAKKHRNNIYKVMQREEGKFKRVLDYAKHLSKQYQCGNEKNPQGYKYLQELCPSLELLSEFRVYLEKTGVISATPIVVQQLLAAKKPN